MDYIYLKDMCSMKLIYPQNKMQLCNYEIVPYGYPPQQNPSGSFWEKDSNIILIIWNMSHHFHKLGTRPIRAPAIPSNQQWNNDGNGCRLVQDSYIRYFMTMHGVLIKSGTRGLIMYSLGDHDNPMT